MKRTFIFALALALCLAATAPAALAWTTSDPGEFPIVTDGPAELTVFMAQPGQVENMETNYATLWYEEKTGVHVNWQIASSADAAEKVSLLLATNNKADMPDIFFNGIGRQMADAYGAQGILLDLTDLIDQYGVNMKALAEHNPGFVSEMVSYDGGIYFLSRYYETVHVRHPQKIWINTKWLKNVGMDIPTTTEEFYEVLKAFKEQDANGNGDPDDEIPMIYYTDGWTSPVPNGLMESFVYSSTQNNKLFVEDGVVKVSYAEEGWREGLRYLKSLYDAGLLDNELFSMTADQAKALAADPKGNRVGVVVGHTVGIVDMSSEDIYDYQVIPPLEGPTGLKQSALEFVSPTPFAAISAYCEEPEIAYRWLDAQLYDSTNDIANGDFTWLNFWYGEQGVGWDVADEGSTGFTGTPAAYKWLFNWGEEQNTHWYETFLINMPEGWNSSLQDEIAEKIADVYNAGFQFCYMDGSEGTNVPFEYHVPNAQYRVMKRFTEPPIFTEGAAKAHFSWHFQAGGNAFDIFPPKQFKEKIAQFPADEAPRMRQSFTRLDFGWWGFWTPRDEDNGTQADMYEYGTSRAAAWNCPVTIQANLDKYAEHPRIDDILEVIRRWEDVRARNLLTDEQKESLKNLEQEHTLLINERGDYELTAVTKIAAPTDISAFLFERMGERYVMYWHERGSAKMRVALDGSSITLFDEIGAQPLQIASDQAGCVTLPADGKRYLRTALSAQTVTQAFAGAQVF